MSADYADPRLPARFWDKVVPEPMSGCWLWSAGQFPNGYGQYKHAGQGVGAHRLMCTLNLGEPLPGEETRHTCDIRPCVNPAHLVWGTAKDNAGDRGRRGRTRSGQALKTHCPHGHPYDEENTRRYAGGRFCRACQRKRDRS